MLGNLFFTLNDMTGHGVVRVEKNKNSKCHYIFIRTLVKKIIPAVMLKIKLLNCC